MTRPWPAHGAWKRRARPLLGTLVEIGLSGTEATEAAFEHAFHAIAAIQAALSRFDPGSDVSRFHALPAGGTLVVGPHAQAVLNAARRLWHASAGLFDVSLGSAPEGWDCDAAGRLRKADARTRLDLGGIAKGYAVDCAVHALQEQDCTMGWVNAGGDLRVFGSIELPLTLRDEATGQAHPFGCIADGAFATSYFATDSHSQAMAPQPSPAIEAHVSVAAPSCIWADALTKVVALSGNAHHALVAELGAQAWLH